EAVRRAVGGVVGADGLRGGVVRVALVPRDVVRVRRLLAGIVDHPRVVGILVGGVEATAEFGVVHQLLRVVAGRSGTDLRVGVPRLGVETAAAAALLVEQAA